MLLAIDPGADSGWAIFDGNGRLSECGLGSPSAGIRSIVQRVLIEVPKYRGRIEKNPQSLIVLALRAGEWAGTFRECSPEYLTPNDWKGSTPKATSHVRIKKKLDAGERDVLDRGMRGLAESKRHNVLDAIGIGLHGVGRNANANG